MTSLLKGDIFLMSLYQDTFWSHHNHGQFQCQWGNHAQHSQPPSFLTFSAAMTMVHT